MRMMKLHPSMNEIILYIYIKPTIYIYMQYPSIINLQKKLTYYSQDT